jgi:protein gp37
LTGIAWTGRTWNPTTGCDKASPGCDHCYALMMAKRLKGMGSPKYQTDGDPRTSGPGFGVAEHPDALAIPLGWRKPQRVFVNSMSDLFHPRVSDEFIARVFSVMALSPNLTFQVLTKRAPRMRSLLSDPAFLIRVLDLTYLAAMGEDPNITGAALRRAAEAYFGYPPNPGTQLAHLVPWPLPHVWLGASVENQEWADRRVPDLLRTPAAVRWVSVEPLLGPVDFSEWMPPGRASWQCSGCRRYFSGPHREVCPACWRTGYWSGSHGGNGRPNGQPLSWVVTGGESGPHARPADLDWFRSVRDQCHAAGVAYFHKQHGGRTPKANGRLLEGVLHDAYPA